MPGPALPGTPARPGSAPGVAGLTGEGVAGCTLTHTPCAVGPAELCQMQAMTSQGATVTQDARTPKSPAVS
jgi:hypothetical protein